MLGRSVCGRGSCVSGSGEPVAGAMARARRRRVKPSLRAADSRQLITRENLQAAIDNMPIGLVMFDAGKRLIICNDRYREMYSLPPAITRHGTHLREMLEHRLDTGSFEGGEREE